MFLKGIVQGTLVLLALGFTMLFASLFQSEDIFEIATYVTVFAGWLIVGYFYKKRYGGFFYAVFFSGNATEYLTKLFQFVMGVGLIWTPVKLYQVGFPIPDVHPLFNTALLLLSVPIAGMPVVAGLVIGGLFCKDKS